MMNASEDSVAGRGLFTLLLGLALAFLRLWYTLNAGADESKLAAIFGVNLNEPALESEERHFTTPVSRILTVVLTFYLSLTELRKRNAFSGVVFLAFAVMYGLALF